MTVQQRPLDQARPVTLPTLPGRGRWNWKRVAQAAWIVLALVMLANFVANIPAYYEAARAFCNLPNPADCQTGLLTLGNVQALEKLHLSAMVTAICLATLTLAVSVLYWVVGLLIFWRKSGEWIGLFASLLLVMFGSIGIYAFANPQTPPLVGLLTEIVILALTPAQIVFAYIFPTGRFTPRWTWVACLLSVLSASINDLALFNVLSFVNSVLFPLGIFLAVGVQIYRYLRVYDAVQRQQTKWFVFGFSAGIALFVIYEVLGAVVPALSASDSWYQLLNALAWLLTWTLLLLSVSIPILRYRLWDIDVLINRTLVYGSLTVLLVGLYASLILALQALVHVVTGNLSQQPLVIVASTLVIAALIQPFRRRIQSSIDRRFYRRKYDAAKVVAAFNETLRQEVDLDQVREQLLAVVQETMQPTHVSLWLRPPASPSLHQAPWRATPAEPSKEEA